MYLVLALSFIVKLPLDWNKMRERMRNPKLNIFKRHFTCNFFFICHVVDFNSTHHKPCKVCLYSFMILFGDQQMCTFGKIYSLKYIFFQRSYVCVDKLVLVCLSMHLPSALIEAFECWYDNVITLPSFLVSLLPMRK